MPVKWGILATGNIAGKFAETVGKMEPEEQIAAVYVATPNRLHFEDCKRCLEAGKHVLCENPLTTRAED